MDRDLSASPGRRPQAVRRIALVASAALAVGLTTWGATSADGSSRHGNRTDVPGVTANLFEWNWQSVGRECTSSLGPSGYHGVQVSPPADSLKRTSLGNGNDTI